MIVEKAALLQSFLCEVMYNVMMFDLAHVTNDQGETPVVACLDDEPLSTVLDRVAASGGYATVFSRGEADEQGRYLVRTVEFLDEVCALEQGAERMTEDESPSPDAPFGLFLDYLETTPCGVVIPKQLGVRAEAVSASRAVQLEPV